MFNLQTIKFLNCILALATCFYSTVNAQSQSPLELEYSKNFTDIIEFVYGDDILSQGGIDSVNKLFESENINEKIILDIGSGLGGVDLYLAQNHAVNIIAIDRVERLITHAQDRLKDKQLKGKITFRHNNKENALTDFEDSSFDIIFSKESILHIENKQPILNDAYRILKPEGKILIIDWISNDEKLGDHIQAMMDIDELNLKLTSEQEYKQLLNQAGFNHISFENLNPAYIGYTEDNLNLINTKKSDFIQKFGQENYNYSLKSWGFQKKAFEKNEVIVMLIKAKK